MVIRFPELGTEEKDVERMSCCRGCENSKKGCKCSGSLRILTFTKGLE